MKNPRRYITAGLTLVAAAATAHLMQSGGGTPGSAPVPMAASVTPVPGGAAPAPAANPERPPNEVTIGAAVANAGSGAPAPAPVEDGLALGDDALTERDKLLNALAPEYDAEPAGPAPVEIALAETAAPERHEGAAGLQQAGDLPVPPRDMLMPAPLPQVGGDLQNRMADTADPADPLAEEPPRSAFGLACGPILSATAQDAAMVRLTVTAPCRGETPITVRHGALEFAARLDHLGSYRADVPALASDAGFAVVFADGTEIATEAEVPGAEAVERVTLMYRGKSGLQIHALEFGADYGEDGHVWTGAPRDAAAARAAGGGFLLELGDPGVTGGQRAQVYTFPDSTRDRDGVVRLSVEAEVTALNCETEVAGQTLERDAEGSLSAVSLTVSMPDCMAIGEYLVLKNLLRDLKIASND